MPENGRKVGSQITRCQTVPHWQWHLDRGLACLRDSWPAALLSIQTAVCLFKTPITVCVYFGKLLFLGQRFHFCICWHQFHIFCHLIPTHCYILVFWWKILHINGNALRKEKCLFIFLLSPTKHIGMALTLF